MRRAAGLRYRHWNRPGGNCLLILLCLDCPQPEHVPPYRAFLALISTHHRAHLRRYPAHHLAFWCWDHLNFHPLTSNKEIATWRPETGLIISTPSWMRAFAATLNCACSCLKTFGRLPSGSDARASAASSPASGAQLTHAFPDVSGAVAAATYPEDGRPKMRGGKRPGAGAPKGNLNAAKHGRRTRNPAVRQVLDALPDELKPVALALLRRARPPAPAAPIVGLPPNVTELRPFARVPETPPPPPPAQSNITDLPYADIILRLNYHEFRHPAAFVRRHHRYLGAIRDALDYADSQQDLTNAPGLIRDDVHTAIGIPIQHHGTPALKCPVCPWIQYATFNPEEETGT